MLSRKNRVYICHYYFIFFRLSHHHIIVSNILAPFTRFDRIYLTRFCKCHISISYINASATSFCVCYTASGEHIYQTLWYLIHGHTKSDFVEPLGDHRALCCFVSICKVMLFFYTDLKFAWYPVAFRFCMSMTLKVQIFYCILF